MARLLLFTPRQGPSPKPGPPARVLGLWSLRMRRYGEWRLRQIAYDATAKPVPSKPKSE